MSGLKAIGVEVHEYFERPYSLHNHAHLIKDGGSQLMSLYLSKSCYNLIMTLVVLQSDHVHTNFNRCNYLRV